MVTFAFVLWGFVDCGIAAVYWLIGGLMGLEPVVAKAGVGDKGNGEGDS